MNKKVVYTILFIILISGLLFGYPTYFLIYNSSIDIKHETSQWAIVEDDDGNQLAVDVNNSSVWYNLRESYNKRSDDSNIFIIGLVISYTNSWHFRFDPSTISYGIGNISPEKYYSINETSKNLDAFLSEWIAIKVKSMNFFNYKYVGIIELIINLTLLIATLLLSSFYLLSKRERGIIDNIKEALVLVKDSPEGISFTLLSQKVAVNQKRLVRLINSRNLQDELGLLITNDRIQFKDSFYSIRVCQIEEQLNTILQLSHNQITQEHYSKLFQFETELKKALLFFSKKSSNSEKKMEIEAKIVMTTNLLDSITLDDFK